MWVGDIQKEKTPLRFLALASKPYVFVAIAASLCSAAASVLEASGSYIFKRIIDAITAGGPGHINEVWMWVWVYIAFFLFLPLLLWRLSGFAGMRWAVGVRATATASLTAYVTQHSSDYFQKRFAGAIGGKIGNTSEAVKKLVERFLWSQIILVITLATSLTLAFITNSLIGWLFVAWLFIVGPINVYLARKRVPFSAAAQREDTRVRAQVIDLLTNVSAMHDFARRVYELGSLRTVIAGRYTIGIKNWTLNEVARIISNVLQLLFVGGIIFAAIHGWSQASVSAGDIVLVLTLVTGLGFRMEELGRDINEFAEYYGQISEGLEELLDPYDVKDVQNAEPLVVTRGEIEFAAVSFNYQDSTKEVLSDFTLKVEPGQKIGLVGRSGAGKSTLIKLLLRHYDVTSGAVKIDGQNIARATQESVRSAIATVPQEPLLFHRTIRENIAYGKAGATEEEIIEAAKLAHADEFVRGLPLTYDTMVGERGVKLSGGERQRVVLARALLKPAKILLLDEATSALDSESEAAIQEALEKLMEGKSVIAIAHRLSTLSHMDRIIVLDQGKIVEDGTHKQLLKKKGLYAELWAHQSGGYIKDEE
jgi:ATP-binding cassette subfamily B protein